MKVNTVDTRHGSFNRHHFSNGNTLPYTGVPFGMNYFILQNQTGSSWHFDPTFPIFQGLRLTHQPSPWMGDFSSLLISPITGDHPQPNLEVNQGSYKIDEAIFKPHHFQAHLMRYRLTVDFVPTKRGGKIRITNDSDKKPGFVLHADEAIDYTIDEKNKKIIGHLKNPINDGKSTLHFHFVLDFNNDAIDKISVRSLTDEDEAKATKVINTDYLYVSLDTNQDEFDVSLGTSFISQEQSFLNLEREVGTNSLDQLKEKAAKDWEYYLNRIEVEDRDKQKEQGFYQYMYRLFLFPQTLYELDENDEPIHFDMYNEKVKAGKLFTNNGYWDTYKTVYPLFSLIIPDKYRDILEGIEHFYKESGHLPKWLSPDERGLMPGTLVNAVIADAAVKGLLDEEKMEFFLEALIEEATVAPTDSKFGRRGVKEMLEHGYVTNEELENVNQTQDNAYSDFCIRQIAKILDNKEVKEDFEEKALNYRNLYDSDTGFMRGKDAEGNFSENFIAEDWGFDYTEGSAWQNGLAIFHNFQDYIELMGGEDCFLEHLTNLANKDPYFEIGNYGMEIHEMSELAVADFGQIAISNQPSFHLPYLFNYVGKPEYTQLLVKQLCTHAFTTGFDGYPGDEDNGSMSGWYIFSMLGFYPVTPGTTEYTLGIPQFDKSTIHLPEGKEFVITTKNNHPQHNFIQKLDLNKDTYDNLYINHEDIMAGGKLDAKLGLVPSINQFNKSQLPYSMKNE